MNTKGIALVKLVLGICLGTTIVTSGGNYLLDEIRTQREAVEMNVGMNIGNALDAPKGEDWGVQIQAEYFDVIAQAGFDTVRLPVRFSDHLEADGKTLNEEFLIEIDGYINHALSLGLVVVLDFHHFLELMENPEAYTQVYYNIWAQLSARYAEYPKELVFELLNEPHNALTSEKWNELVARSVVIVRELNPTRKIIIDTSHYANASTINELVIPKDRNIIVSFHYYEPNDFAFQGNLYHPGYEHLSGITWTATPDQLAKIEADFQVVADYAAKHEVDIFLGEFGVTQEVPDEYRVQWTRAVAEAASAFGFSYAYWELGSGFGIYDIEIMEWNKEMLQALIWEVDE